MSPQSPEAPWREVRRYRSRAEAEQHALVLVAVGIDCRLADAGGWWALQVAAEQAEAARRELAAYASENLVRQEPALRRLGEGLEGVLVYCAVLLGLHAAAGRQAFSRDWLAAGRADAELIVGGEWWRALTALGLHADFEHLLANLAFGSLFGLYLSQATGAGLAWLAILLAGGLGNVANAVAQPAGHAAIGASTAVFGALGLLAGAMWRRQARSWRRRLRQWTPLAAGLMLLAFVGVGGERTDVGAHIAGFLAGCLLGASLYLAGPYLPTARRAQYAYAAAAAALFAAAWAVALAAAPAAGVAGAG